MFAKQFKGTKRLEKQKSPDFTNTKIAFSHLSKNKIRKRIFLFRLLRWPFLLPLGRKFIFIAAKLHLPLKFILKPTLFEQFCAGENLKEGQETIAVLKEHNVGASLDYVVEAKDESRKSTSFLKKTILKSIDHASLSKNKTFVVLKISAFFHEKDLVLLASLANKNLPKKIIALKETIYELCSHAKQKSVPLLIDAEYSWIQDGIDLISEEIIEEFNSKKALIYHTVQMYRKDRLSYLKNLSKKAEDKNFILGIKLVRGAYLQAEASRAHQKNYPNPLFSSKKETDESFNLALKFCLNNLSFIFLFLGTHNLKSIQIMISEMQRLKLKRDDPRLIFAQLFGMGDHLTFNLARSAYLAYKYLPYGPMTEAIPYLLRRAEENTSIQDASQDELKLLLQELKLRANSNSIK